MLLIASQGEDEYRPNFPVDAQEGDGVPRNSATRGPPQPPAVGRRVCERCQPALPRLKFSEWQVGVGEGRW